MKTKLFRLMTTTCLAMALPFSAQAQDAVAEEESVNIEADGNVAEEDPTFVFKTEEEEELESFEREMTEAFAIFSEIFKTEPLTPEQEALLPLAKQVSDKIVPEGSMATAMDQMMEPMMELIAAEASGDTHTRLAEVTGMELDELYLLDEVTTEAALAAFDPNFKERNKALGGVIGSMVSQMFEAMEPSYREALSRALTLRFDEGEMNELLGFFATPIGAKFAKESFLVHYDPQMMAVMEQMGPAMVEILPGMMEEFEKIETDIGNVRTFSELSEAERAEVARLLEKSVSELDALVPQADVEVLDESDEEGVV